MSENTDNSSRKLLFGMIILALSGIALGIIVGLIGTNWYLNNQVLSEMSAKGYILTGEADATSDDIVEGKTAYVDGKLVVGTMKVKDTSNATATSSKILEGKTAYVDGELVTGTLKTYVSSEITPSTIAANIDANVYLAQDYVVVGDPNLISDNIKQGVSVFKVVGRLRTIAKDDEGEMDYD